ncbi:MAG: CT583 family protein [Chlamydiales bacterium]
MAKLSSILQQRFRKKEKPKMSELAEKSGEGNLTPFSGLFRVGPLGSADRETIVEILQKYEEESSNREEDLQLLMAITSEVKAINNQAAMLHGERIKRAQAILKRYKEGAFTAWLMATYGNRQTPYNFLQYYDFYSQMPQPLHSQIEAMPRQAVYTLASRDGALEKKEEIVRNYKGETKQELITMIRTQFPLADNDKRKEDLGEAGIKSLLKLSSALNRPTFKLKKGQKQQLIELLEKLIQKVNNAKDWTETNVR